MLCCFDLNIAMILMLYLRWIGVFLEILGAFLLAVEAIKTSNLLAVGLRLRTLERRLNPRITFVSAPPESTAGFSKEDLIIISLIPVIPP